MTPPFNYKDIFILIGLVIIFAIGVLWYMGASKAVSIPEGVGEPPCVVQPC